MPWVADAYEALRTLEAEPQAVAALRILDRVKSEFEAVSPVTKLILGQARAHHKREAEALSAALASREADANALRERTAALEAEANVLRERAATLETKLGRRDRFAKWGRRMARKLIPGASSPRN